MTLAISVIVFSFVFAFVLARPVINYLIHIKSTQSFRPSGPKSHAIEKQGTPTMGGWIFLCPILLVTAFLYVRSNYDMQVLLVGLAIVLGAAMGAVDDGLKILQSNYKGISSVQKLLLQYIFSSALVFALKNLGDFESHIFLPWDLPAWLIALLDYFWAFAVIAGASNAINLTDGLDGLASSVSIVSFLSCAAVLRIMQAEEMFLICWSIVSALFVFFLYNKKPAQIFMGDTGSLALGMGLGTIAYLYHFELYLLVFAFVPVLETLSVVVQVLSAKLSRKFLGKDIRPFKMAPLHHHMELCGIAETKVVTYLFALQVLASGLLFFNVFLR